MLDRRKDLILLAKSGASPSLSFDFVARRYALGALACHICHRRRKHKIATLASALLLFSLPSACIASHAAADRVLPEAENFFPFRVSLDCTHDATHAASELSANAF